MIGATTTHAVSIDGGSAWLDTVDIAEFTFPQQQRDTSEESYLDAADKYKEFTAGMIDAGELSLTLKWNAADTGQVALTGAFEGDGDIMGKVTFPDGATFTYDAVVTGAGREVPKNEQIKQTFSLKLSGKPTEA